MSKNRSSSLFLWNGPKIVSVTHFQCEQAMRKSELSQEDCRGSSLVVGAVRKRTQGLSILALSDEASTSICNFNEN